jgi:hypothetical protein
MVVEEGLMRVRAAPAPSSGASLRCGVLFCRADKTVEPACGGLNRQARPVILKKQPMGAAFLR